MKRIRETILKAFLFFLIWLIGVGIIPTPEVENPALWRFFAELIPLLVTGLMTVIFWLIEKGKIPLCLTGNWLKGIITGSIIGIVWLVIPALVMYIFRIIRFEGSNDVSLLGIWFISVLLNVIMQELLVRGYLYQMVKRKCNTIAATFLTTGLFTLLHGGAFEAGVVAVLNVLTMSLLMTVMLEYTKSLWSPILAHFIWNAVGALVLNGVSLAEDYPNILNTVFVGNEILTGGACKIEGSIIVLMVNIFLITAFIIWNKTVKCLK